MNTIYNVKPVNFKLGDYLNKGLELFKKDMGTFILAFFFCMLLSFIPLCSFLAMGNFFKLCRKIDKGQSASASEIFNFDDFSSYLILQLIIIGGVIAIYIPLIFLSALAPHGDQSSATSGIFAILMMIFMIAAYVGIFYFLLKGFYVVALISLAGVKDIKQAWNMSKIMTTDNLLNIFLFSLVTGLVMQLGLILCFVGIFASIPLVYCMQYFAYEDGVEQISYDEIAVIGNETNS